MRTLLEIFNQTRRKVWARQDTSFFEEARIDLDGTLVATTGECEQGLDIAYNGAWGYHPLVVSLANTGEVLSLVNRSGNRPSHEGAAAEVDRALCLQATGRYANSATHSLSWQSQWHTFGCATFVALQRTAA